MLGRRPTRGVSTAAETQAAEDPTALPHGLAPSSPPQSPTTAGADRNESDAGREPVVAEQAVVAGDIAGAGDDRVEGFPYEIFETGPVAQPPERWIEPYAGGVALSAQKPPTDLLIGAGRRRGLTRSTK